MFESLVSFFTFLEVYVIPIIFAIGVIFFLYGFMLHFILELGGGRRNILHSCLFFATALLMYLCIAGLQWLLTDFSFSTTSNVDDRDDVGAEIETREDILKVPNVPRR